MVTDFELHGQAGAGEGVGDADGVAAPAGGFEGGPVELVPVGHGGVDEVFGAEFDDAAGGEVGAFDGFVTAEAIEVDGRRSREDFIGGRGGAGEERLGGFFLGLGFGLGSWSGFGFGWGGDGSAGGGLITAGSEQEGE